LPPVYSHTAINLRYTPSVKIDLQTALAIVGIGLTLSFGIWSIVTGKVKAGSRFVKLFLVLLVLYTGQIIGNKWFGGPLLPVGVFETSVSMMLVWLMYAAFRDND
jgi:hypothetical protein